MAATSGPTWGPAACTASISEVRNAVRTAQQSGKRVGLIPTMGALHEGHLSLVDAARRECDMVLASIFVNPTQFGPHEDLESYPRSLPEDLQMLGTRGCDLAFAPTVDAMYGPDHGVSVDVGDVAKPLEGALRPGHFRGVATVVLKLFHIAPANLAYFGEKDYQQTLVVQRLTTDLNLPIEIRVCPTIREPDGLAMSSRNAYLSPDERRRALSLHRALTLAQRMVAEGVRDASKLRAAMLGLIQETGGVEVDYVAFVAAGSVRAVETVAEPTVAAIAARVGRTRLIDNCHLG